MNEWEEMFARLHRGTNELAGNVAKIIEELHATLSPFVEAYRAKTNPGDSDLDNEQPYDIRVTLGDCRTADTVSRQLTRLALDLRTADRKFSQ